MWLHAHLMRATAARLLLALKGYGCDLPSHKDPERDPQSSPSGSTPQLVAAVAAHGPNCRWRCACWTHCTLCMLDTLQMEMRMLDKLNERPELAERLKAVATQLNLVEEEVRLCLAAVAR